jgi:hypothetical protein
MSKFCADAPTEKNLLTRVSTVSGYTIQEPEGSEEDRQHLFERVDNIITE